MPYVHYTATLVARVPACCCYCPRRTLEAYTQRLGTTGGGGDDWSNGLLAAVRWAEQNGKVQYSLHPSMVAAPGPGCCAYVPPEPIKDRSSLRACSACVGDEAELLLYCTVEFSLRFISPTEMRGHITENKVMCLHLWSR